MSQLIDNAAFQWITAGSLTVLCLGFACFYLLPALRLATRLRAIRPKLNGLRNSRGTDPRTVEIKDPLLSHLWREYCDTLHPETAVDPRNGMAKTVRFRSTLPANVIFNASSIVDGRLRVEFFKHLPGLLTGIGIIGTFLGLIHGLGAATANGGLETKPLIESVKEAFYISAGAIIAAMVVTFFEKLIVSWLHRLTDDICRMIDSQFASGAGEEYLARLVAATEQSATHSAQLKDSLVGELRDILERLADRQIEASGRQQAELRQQLSSTLQQPLEGVARSLQEFGKHQSSGIAQGFQDQMATFAQKLDEVLGGQVDQAKDLQVQTLQSLEKAIAAFQGMAKSVGAAGESATQAIADQMRRTLDDMSTRQGQMSDTMRSFIDELRAAAGKSQAETDSRLAELLTKLGAHISATVAQLEAQAAASTSATLNHQTQISDQATRSIEALAGEVRAQTQTIEIAAQSMRGAVADLASGVDRTVVQMGQGAGLMSEAASAFTRSGQGLAETFDRSSALIHQLVQTASTLTTASQQVEAVVADYRAARETFRTVVETLQLTVETARRDASLTSDVVTRIETAAQKLIAAQGEADTYLGKLNGVLAEAHEKFSDGMLMTVDKTNREFHEHLNRSTKLLAGTVAELEGTLIEIKPRRTGVNGTAA